MPIILPPGLPAARALRREGMRVETPASAPDRDALRILLVNLMPDKPRTETQFARRLAETSHSVTLAFTVPERHLWRHTAADHLHRFYLPWREARRRCFDALIVTGAPVETLGFEDVDYWPEVCDILDWSAWHRLPAMFVCWAAQAALWRRHGVPKHRLPAKRFGVYRHDLHGDSALFAGLGGAMEMPVSRHTETRPADLPAGAGLRVSAVSRDSGLGLVEDPVRRAIYLFNHPEYDATALADEYARDMAAGLSTSCPENYRPGETSGRPLASWYADARLYYRNWLDLIARDRRCPMAMAPRPADSADALRGAISAVRHLRRPAWI